MKIEPLQQDQAEEVMQLILRSLGTFDEVGSVLASAFRRVESMERTYSTEGSAYFVLNRFDQQTQQKQLIGGGGLGPLAGLPFSERIGEIRELVIDEQFRGQGFGKAILAYCLERALCMGYRRIYLETTPQMRHARHLFEAFGFRPITQGQTKKASKSPIAVNEEIACYYLFECNEVALADSLFMTRLRELASLPKGQNT